MPFNKNEYIYYYLYILYQKKSLKNFSNNKKSKKHCSENILREKSGISYQIYEIREKYGSLRIYGNIEPKEWHTQLWKYEYLTENACYECGKIGVPLTDDGWILPICRDCYEHPKEESMYEKSPYDKVVCKYDGGYKFEPIIKIRHLSVESERNEKIDCSDVLDRVDQKINQKLL